MLYSMLIEVHRGMVGRVAVNVTDEESTDEGTDAKMNRTIEDQSCLSGNQHTIWFYSTNWRLSSATYQESQRD